MSAGKKRASPGADVKNDLPDISDEQVAQLEELQRRQERAETAVALNAIKVLQSVYEKRRPAVKAIPKFWPTALYRSRFFELHAAHTADRDAITYLEDVWIDRNDVEPRAFKIEFHFKENPYFSNSILVKDFKYVPPPSSADTTVDQDGLTAAQADFNEQRDIEAQTCKIDWKSDSKNLVANHPRKKDPEDDHEVQDHGSFFNFFTEVEDEDDVATVIMDVFDEAIRHFTNDIDIGDEDITDSEEEGEDEGDEEIDLEQPKKKARKV